MDHNEAHIDKTSVVEKLLRETGRPMRWLSDSTGIPYETMRRRLKNPDQLVMREVMHVAEAMNIDVDYLSQKIMSEIKK